MDELWHTPLHSAAWNGKLKCVSALVAAGANLLANSQYGKTPLDLARREAIESGYLRAVEVRCKPASCAPCSKACIYVAFVQLGTREREVRDPT